MIISSTYDHRTLKTRLPVRSALFKQRTGGLVVRWVTTSEYPLLYVFVFLLSWAASGGKVCVCVIDVAGMPLCDAVVDPLLEIVQANVFGSP